jgi:two-component system phosphate regulon response regulator PhoB
LRSIVFHFEDVTALTLALGDAPVDLPLPEGQTGYDGEWVLAIIEIGRKRRSTATASRIVARNGGLFVAFERRDWERLVSFATARSEQLRVMRVGIPTGPPGDPPISEPAPTSQSPPSSSGRFAVGGRVLVVDDDEATRNVVGQVLSTVGLRVVSVASGEEALPVLEGGDLDLLVLDVNLPGMSGLEVVRSVRRSATLTLLPILVVSGNASSKDIVDGFAAGADDFVVKPFRAPELAARIFGLLRRAKSNLPPIAPA